jgi:hypothetical protein
MSGSHSQPNKAETANQSYSIFREFWDFLKNSKKWWLLPILVVILLMSAFVVLSTQSVVFPMIYAIF